MKQAWLWLHSNFEIDTHTLTRVASLFTNDYEHQSWFCKELKFALLPSSKRQNLSSKKKMCNLPAQWKTVKLIIYYKLLTSLSSKISWVNTSFALHYLCSGAKISTVVKIIWCYKFWIRRVMMSLAPPPKVQHSETNSLRAGTKTSCTVNKYVSSDWSQLFYHNWIIIV